MRRYINNNMSFVITYICAEAIKQYKASFASNKVRFVRTFRTALHAQRQERPVESKNSPLSAK